MAYWSFMASEVLVIVQANVIRNYSCGDGCISVVLAALVPALDFHHRTTTLR